MFFVGVLVIDRSAAIWDLCFGAPDVWEIPTYIPIEETPAHRKGS